MTPRQLQVLRLIDNSIARRGYAPTLRELAAQLGVTSIASVHAKLVELEAQGFIRRRPRRARGIEMRRAVPGPRPLPASTPAAVGRAGVGR